MIQIKEKEKEIGQQTQWEPQHPTTDTAALPPLPPPAPPQPQYLMASQLPCLNIG